MQNDDIQNLAELEFDEIVLEVKRVIKVVKGGKNLRFRAIVIVGDSFGKIGLGIGKAEDVALSVQKAILHAKKNLEYLAITKNGSIPHLINYKYGSAKIRLLPAKKGTGVKAGGVLRAILGIGGFTNVVGKQLGSSSILNNAKATIAALKQLKEQSFLLSTLSNNKKIKFGKLLKNFQAETNGVNYID